ncbi:MAG: flagellar filament capping protein FliD [Planctomycetes bacterium]|nr:flagellar filament capping protein FliD [Planctomycetota bacterium]
MSTAGISFGGLASGLDSKAIINALVAVERRPIAQLETKKTSLNRQKSLYSDLGGLLEKLNTASRALKTTTEFLKMKGTSDDPNVLTVSATSAAAPGAHTVRVLQLATAQINASTGSASATTSNGSWGEFTLTVGSTQVPITPTSTSLEGIASAINTAATDQSLGVRAEVVDTGGTGNSRYQLVMRSLATGLANGFTIGDVDGDPAFASVMNGLAGNRVAQALDARVQVNGVLVTRPTNSVAGAIAGVTLDLKAIPNPNKDVIVTIAADASETAKKVQDFVDAYNKVVDFAVEQNTLGSDGKAKNPLFGDTTLRSLRSALRSVVGGEVTTTGNQAYQMLAQIGVRADTQGRLTLTQSKFEEALTADQQAVAKIFTDSTNGLGKRLETTVKQYTDSVDGLLKTRRDGFDRLVSQTQSRIDQGEKRLALYQKQLETKYSNLETLMTRLQSQGSSVGNIRSR